MIDTDTRCVAVFTARSPQRILREGGSGEWALDAARVRTLPFLVCIQNQNNPDRNFSDASEPHGSAYLVGRIRDVVPAPVGEDRWLIRISEYSVIRKANAWQGWRNPVKYGVLGEFGIDLSELKFHPLPESSQDAEMLSTPKPATMDDGTAPISIAVAKKGLAAFYAVAPEAVEIVIRG